MSCVRHMCIERMYVNHGWHFTSKHVFQIPTCSIEKICLISGHSSMGIANKTLRSAFEDLIPKSIKIFKFKDYQYTGNITLYKYNFKI